MEKYAIKKEVKWKMIAGIDKEELVLLTFSREETETKLNWKHSREFEYNGEMYDIVETLEQNDSIAYWCWWDHEETKLNRQLSDLIDQTAGQSQQNKQNKQHLFQFLNSIYFTEVNDWEFYDSSGHPSHHSVYLNLYSSLHFPPSTPPPNS